MDQLKQRLLARAYLYDDPASFTAGVEAALSATSRSDMPMPTTPAPSEAVLHALHLDQRRAPRRPPHSSEAR